jgi:hypothetical protein
MGCEFSFNRSVLTNRPAVVKNYFSRVFVVITSLFPLMFFAGLSVSVLQDVVVEDFTSSGICCFVLQQQVVV